MPGPGAAYALRSRARREAASAIIVHLRLSAALAAQLVSRGPCSGVTEGRTMVHGRRACALRWALVLLTSWCGPWPPYYCAALTLSVS